MSHSRRWLLILAAVAAWLALTAVYGFSVLMATIIAFGREADSSHLICWAVAILLWFAATIWAGGLMDNWLARTNNRPAE